jgi:hypothetical protein
MPEEKARQPRAADSAAASVAISGYQYQGLGLRWLADLSLSTTSNICSSTWVFAYQPPLASNPRKGLGKVQQVTRHWQDSRGVQGGMFFLVMLTGL